MDEERRDLKIVENEVLEALNQVRRLRGEAPLNALPEPPYCSFCGKSKDEVSALIAGQSAFICGECVLEAQRLIRRSS